MAVKSKTKTKSKAKPRVKPKAKTAVKSKTAKSKPVKAKTVKKTTKPKAVAASKTKSRSKTETSAKTTAKRLPEKTLLAAPKTSAPAAKRSAPTRSSLIKRTLRPVQFTYMKAPGSEYAFEVGDTVEVFCDHEKSRERVRGWIKGIVVQVDYKMVAVQFRSNVFLTDGWMVPDRILWYPLNSEHIRALPGKKSAVKKELIPDY